jgi:quercetin dioxygenase-like cupin family protein
MRTTTHLMRAALALVFAAMVAVAAPQAAAPRTITPAVKLMIGAAAHSPGKRTLVREVLTGEIPGIASTFVSLSSGLTHNESASSDEDRVFLVLSGGGALTANGTAHLVRGETIAHFPVGAGVDVKAAGAAGLDVLILRLAITPVDREDLAAHADLNSVAYVKSFKDCEPYGEDIKSAKTVSRTLLPKDIVPRMSIGTVETDGPDKVARHRHPMLEQYFLGLGQNDITVVADRSRTPLKAWDLFHIPSASNHGAEVAAGHKLYYVWMDFFQDRKGLEYLKVHKPLQPAGKP